MVHTTYNQHTILGGIPPIPPTSENSGLALLGNQANSPSPQCFIEP